MGGENGSVQCQRNLHPIIQGIAPRNGRKIEGPRVTLTPEIQNRRILRASSARQSQLTFMLGFKVRACVAVNLMKHKTLLKTKMHPSRGRYDRFIQPFVAQ